MLLIGQSAKNKWRLGGMLGSKQTSLSPFGAQQTAKEGTERMREPEHGQERWETRSSTGSGRQKKICRASAVSGQRDDWGLLFVVVEVVVLRPDLSM